MFLLTQVPFFFHPELNGLLYYCFMVTTLHFHFSIGCLILTGGHSESGGLAALIAFIIGAASISGDTVTDIPWDWNKNKARAGRSSDPGDPACPFLP